MMLKKEYYAFIVLWIVMPSCNTDDCKENMSITFQESSENFDYYFHPQDEFKMDTNWMESHYLAVVESLEINPSEKLSYFKYMDRNHLFGQTNKVTNGFAEIGTWNFHTIWHPDGHEFIHTLVINEIGHPPALFNEGIAVALSAQAIYGIGNYIAVPTWNGMHIDSIASELNKNELIQPLEDLLESESFFSFDTNKTYPIAGSFCKYLIDLYSISSFKNMITQMDFHNGKTETKNIFYATYNKSIDNLWSEWLDQL